MEGNFDIQGQGIGHMKYVVAVAKPTLKDPEWMSMEVVIVLTRSVTSGITKLLHLHLLLGNR
jgi:hypothetical protein